MSFAVRNCGVVVLVVARVDVCTPVVVSKENHWERKIGFEARFEKRQALNRPRLQGGATGRSGVALNANYGKSQSQQRQKKSKSTPAAKKRSRQVAKPTAAHGACDVGGCAELCLRLNRADIPESAPWKWKHADETCGCVRR